MGFIPYVGAFVVDQPTIVVYYDDDFTDDFVGCTTADITFTPTGQTNKISWGTVPVTPLLARFTAADGSFVYKISALLIPITPKRPPVGCLGQFLWRFKRRPKHSDPRIGGTGTVGGTLNKGGGKGSDGHRIPDPFSVEIVLYENIPVLM